MTNEAVLDLDHTDDNAPVYIADIPVEITLHALGHVDRLNDSAIIDCFTCTGEKTFLVQQHQFLDGTHHVSGVFDPFGDSIDARFTCTLDFQSDMETCIIKRVR